MIDSRLTDYFIDGSCELALIASLRRFNACLALGFLEPGCIAVPQNNYTLTHHWPGLWPQKLVNSV